MYLHLVVLVIIVKHLSRKVVVDVEKEQLFLVIVENIALKCLKNVINTGKKCVRAKINDFNAIQGLLQGKKIIRSAEILCFYHDFFLHSPEPTETTKAPFQDVLNTLATPNDDKSVEIELNQSNAAHFIYFGHLPTEQS